MISGQMFKDIADAIREKDGNPSTMKITQMAERIRNIPSGGGSDEPQEKDVIFIDTDGTILYSYDKAEFLTLAEMPAGRTDKEGLVFEGWNYSLEDAKEQVRQIGTSTIGALYLPTDEATHVFIEICTVMTVSVIGMARSSGTRVTVDFGDGETWEGGVSSIRAIWCTHTYQSKGEYEIKIDCPDGYTYAFYDGTLSSNAISMLQNGPKIIGIASGNSATNLQIAQGIKKINVGKRCSLFGCSYLQNVEEITFSQNTAVYSMERYVSLKACTIPDKLYNGLSQSIKFDYTVNLKYVSLAKNVSSVSIGYTSVRRLDLPLGINGSINVYNTMQLKKLIVPPGIITIIQTTYNYALQEINFQAENITIATTSSAYNTLGYGYNLKRATFAGNVNEFPTGAFRSNAGLEYIDLSNCTAIPVCTSNMLVDGNLNTSEIIVPDALYNDWIVATNWSSKSSIIVKKSESRKYGGSA